MPIGITGISSSTGLPSAAAGDALAAASPAGSDTASSATDLLEPGVEASLVSSSCTNASCRGCTSTESSAITDEEPAWVRG